MFNNFSECRPKRKPNPISNLFVPQGNPFPGKLSLVTNKTKGTNKIVALYYTPGMEKAPGAILFDILTTSL